MAAEKKDTQKGKTRSLGNTGLPFGLCKRFNISLPQNATPRDAWEALKKKAGWTPDMVYRALDNKRDGAKTQKQDKSFALHDSDSVAAYEKITKNGGYSIEELEKLPVFNRIQEEAEKSRYRQAKRLGMPDEYDGLTFKIKTPEREKAREQWVGDFLAGKGVETRPQAPLKRGYKMTIVVGLPASGKSTKIATPLSEEQGAFIFDSDEMKKLIDGFDGGKNAHGVHYESKDLLKRAQSAFTDGNMKGTNIVFPVIGDEAAKTMEKMQPFINAGYDVEIAYKKADTRESMNRVVSRAIKTGRFIPKDVVMKYNNDNIVAAYNELLNKGIKRSKYSEI